MPLNINCFVAMHMSEDTGFFPPTFTPDCVRFEHTCDAQDHVQRMLDNSRNTPMPPLNCPVDGAACGIDCFCCQGKTT
jgi:hypothetical protein